MFLNEEPLLFAILPYPSPFFEAGYYFDAMLMTKGGSFSFEGEKVMSVIVH